ncbi:MAG: GNAT family N-acetyltransferase [Clostridiales bacterium]|jgi:ribosomal protein S18 acetylase RimI-like enzyme|nr:GNAT family N-acetyltransferase [Clostridiales bacterium]
MKDCGIVIRKINADDALAVSDIERQSFAGDFWSAGLVDGEIKSPSSVGVVAEVSGVVAAYAFFRAADDEAELLRIAVSGPFRRMKIASRLFLFAVGILKDMGVKKIFLEVRAGNAAAKAFYEGRGFSFVSVRRAYYDDGEDGDIMRLDLNGKN